MANGHIEILIGARADRSLEAIFGAMPKRAEKARAGVERALNAGGRNSFKDYEAASGRAANKTVADQTRAVLSIARMREREERKVEAQRIASERRVLAEQARGEAQRLAGERRVSSEQNKIQRAQASQERRLASERSRSYAAIQRETARRDREQQRSTTAEQRGIERSFAYRTAYHGVIRYAPAALHRGARFAGDMLRGAGVDFNVGSAMGRNVERENEAIGLAQQERMKTGGETIGSEKYQEIAGKVGVDLKTDPTKILQLMRAFSGASGEFTAIQGHAGDVASIALAKGADPAETGAAAGKLFNQLHDMPAVIGVLRALGAQTAVGALESRVMMGQIGRIASGSFKFEGGAATNIPKLFALAESAGEAGGADTAPRAATAVNSFVNMLTKGARVKGLEGFLGKEAVFDKSGQHIKDPVELIFKSIAKARGNLKTLGGLFPEMKSFQVVSAFANRYSAAGGGAAGEVAMREQYKKYAGASLTPEIEQKNLADYLKSTGASAQEFQTNLDAVVAKMAKEVLPALAELAPKALTAAKLMGDAAGWVASHPKSAVGAAVGLGMGRAVVESGVRFAFEKGLTAALKATARGSFAQALGGGAGGSVGALALSAGAVTLAAGAVYMANEGLKQQTGGLGTLDLISKVIEHEGRPGHKPAKNMMEEIFNTVSDYQAEQARLANPEAAAASREKQSLDAITIRGHGAAPPVGKNTVLRADVDPAALASAVKAGMQGVGIYVLNMPPPGAGSPDAPPQPGSAGRAPPR